MARRNRPKSPEMIAAEKILRRARSLDAVNVPPDAAVLPHGEDIEVTRKGDKRGGQKADHDGARRLDAFEALRDGMATGAFDAVRRYERDILIRRGENDRGMAVDRVDRTAGLVTDAMLEAAKRIEAVQALMPERELWLLHELIAPSRAYDNGWRGAVAHVTAETNANAQGAVVRAACLHLRDAYEKLLVVGRKAA